MAVDFQGRETMVPPEVLTDDDVSSDDRNINHYWSSSESASNGFGSCGSSSSNLNTPPESERDSTETQSDEEDFIAELTRQMADYMLQEDDQNPPPKSASHNTKSGKWSECHLSSKLQHSKSLMGTSENPTSNLGHSKNPKNIGFHSNQAFNDDQIQPIQLRNQQHMKHSGLVSSERRGKITQSTQQQLQRKKNTELGNGGRVPPFGLSQAGSGMRAVFLGGPGSKTACSGTGVFLPRGNKNAPEPRKKRGCSTVLIPARVLKALELHFNNMDTLPNLNGGGGGGGGFPAYPNQHDVVMGGGVYAHQKRPLATQAPPAMNHHQELQLPQEWTY